MPTATCNALVRLFIYPNNIIYRLQNRFGCHKHLKQVGMATYNSIQCQNKITRWLAILFINDATSNPTLIPPNYIPNVKMRSSATCYMFSSFSLLCKEKDQTVYFNKIQTTVLNLGRLVQFLGTAKNHFQSCISVRDSL